MHPYIMATAGGVLIGLAATVLLKTIGKIAGISGILGQSLTKLNQESYWRYLFILGLITGGGCWMLLNPTAFDYSFNASPVKIVLAGLLVGFGTRLGSGCTSGHGICGMARLSKRSIVATILFMLTAIIIVLVEGKLSQ